MSWHRFRNLIFGSLALGVFAAAAGLTLVSLNADTTTDARPTTGLRDNTPQVHALVNAHIVTAPGLEISRGTVVLRNGMIVAVGAEVAVPADARVWDLEGKTVYPGLIDAYGKTSVELPKGGSPHWNSLITPQLNVGDHYQPDNDLHKKLRSQGVTARLVAPDSGIIKGTSCVVLTGDSASREAIVASGVAQHVRLTAPRGRGRDSYPNSPMGAVALARQSLYDADWHRRAWLAHEADATVPRPARNDALVALRSTSDGGGLFIFDAMNELYYLRADRVAREFGLRAVMLGSGHEYKRIEAIKQTGRSIIVPLDFPKPPNVATAEAVLNTTLDRLMHWDIAPENPGRLDKAGIKIALTSHGLSDQKDFLAAVRTAVERGLGPAAALRALTTAPAEILGVSDRLGTVAQGKLANLIVTDGPLFEKKTKLHAVWVQGKRFQLITDPRLDVRGTWRVEVTGTDGKSQAIVIQLTGEQPGSLGGSHHPETGKHAKSSTKLIKPSLHDAQFQTSFDAAKLGHEGKAQLTAVVSMPAEGTPAWTGFVVWPDGQREPLTAERISTREEDDAKKDDAKKDDAEKDDAEKDDAKKDDAEKDDAEKDDAKKDESSEQDSAAEPSPSALFAVNFPLGAYGRDAAPVMPASVLFENATIWTCDASGVLQNASVWIGNGKILAVGQNLEVPAGTLVIDCRGKHISPGIIDCHSHMATDGGVNESAQAITAEVRIGDFIDADDINIYRQLAGGVTSSNILHGSANPIGGQNQVIKLRWGALPEAMKFSEAPAGIKFALGENVKQSNWGDEYTTRYPQTRMGVEQIMRDEFAAARTYHERWQDWNENHQGLPPRRDLELDAVAEIVNGQRWIHCHSYRQDEILALIRTLDDFGIQIGTFQHVLEGYKVADAMAKHGAMGSSFSDWWAYKFEVYDAIPYNGALMHNAGVVVSFNSDDRELARHLNHEAAKAVKYGGVPAEEALKFVTLNPARQLRIEQYTGSLTTGKHADLVVWSGSPLSNFSRCEQTWIDGRKYFDLVDDATLRVQSRKMHAALVQKILKSGAKMETDGERKPSEDELWDRDDTFCHHHQHPFELNDEQHRHNDDNK
jgi:N-acetylglucosamine-6-phosphate deacetylase